jgi:23S rRNA (cytidine1920-2'-O)/16S rRNA (cytidine1409-2'-O)-methyltransferase
VTPGVTEAARARLDAEMVRRGLAPSRTRAAALIAAGRVEVGGVAVLRAATPVRTSSPLALRPAPTGEPDLVSRGGRKLAAALAAFDLAAAGRRCLDAGASTGGFTDVLLRAGATHVTAVDVGHGQLAAPLRSDPRVTSLEGVNVRSLSPNNIGGAVALTVADLSFIPLRLVLEALLTCTDPSGDLIVLVKPQFEVGREDLGTGGIVRDPALHAQALRGVLTAAAALGAGARGAIRSPLLGQRGNLELLLWLTRRHEPVLTPDDAVAMVGLT